MIPRQGTKPLIPINKLNRDNSEKKAHNTTQPNGATWETQQQQGARNL